MTPAARPRTPTPAPAKPAVRQPAKAYALKVPARPAAGPIAAAAVFIGVAASVIFHATALLALYFVPMESGVRKERDPGLQIVLVNARHKRAPKDAQALAQANLDGGGDSAQKGAMPTSPMPLQDSVRDGDALVETQQKVKQLEAQQRELMARNKAANAAVQQAQRNNQTDQPNDAPPPPKPGLDMVTATAIARQEAVVDRGLKDYAERPRKGVISPRTREYHLAQYGEDWRLKVQRVGELNFPRSAQGSLYGSVQVDVTLRPDGSILSAEISRPSPDPKINDAALRIIKLASPYAPFPPDIRKNYDVVELIRTLNFTREDIGVTSQ